MDYNEILKEAAGLMGPYCKACPVCNGRACGNCVPGPGSKLPGNTAARNYDKWQEIFVNMDTLNPNANVDTSFELFGKKFSAPVFIAPLGALPLHYGDKYDDITYNRVLINAAANYGICAMTGDGEFPQLIPDAVDEMSKIGGIGIPTIKPWNKEVVFEKLDYVKAHNVFAVAMDVDGAGLPFLKKLSPFLRIELLCFELRNKIFISEFIQSSVFFFVMQIFFGAFYVHISGIPLISECRNTVNTPVDKNTKFVSCVPFRSGMLAERIPGIRVRSLCDHLIDQRKVFFFFHFVALFYIFWSFSTDAYMLPSNFLVVYI